MLPNPHVLPLLCSASIPCFEMKGRFGTYPKVYKPTHHRDTRMSVTLADQCFPEVLFTTAE